jgi:hypothetical protein
MAKREDVAASGKQKPRGKVTDQFVQAGKQNLAKGREVKRKQEEARQASGQPLGQDRWSMLLDGRLTVRDLDDEEIAKQRVYNKRGSFTGKARILPSHLSQAFQSEALRRANEKFRTAAPEAVEGLMDIAKDVDVRTSDRIKAYIYIIDRSLGRTPETIRIEGASSFDAVTMEALGLDRDVATDAGGTGSEDGE